MITPFFTPSPELADELACEKWHHRAIACGNTENPSAWYCEREQQHSGPHAAFIGNAVLPRIHPLLVWGEEALQRPQPLLSVEVDL